MKELELIGSNHGENTLSRAMLIVIYFYFTIMTIIKSVAK